jgi:metallopeptidase family M12-like protein
MIPRYPLTIGTLLLAAVSTASAQEQRPFPMLVLDSPATGVLDLQPVAADLDALLPLDAVVLTGVPQPDGSRIDLNLTRIHFDFDAVGVYVDGYMTDWNSGNLSLWKGERIGVPGSDVQLALSSLGCYGWINDGVETVHLTAQAGADGSWKSSRARWVTNEAMRRADGKDLGVCMNDELRGGPINNGGLSVGDPLQGPAATILEAKLAIETDWQLFQKWGSLSGVQNYIMALLAASSDRYLTQVEVIQTYPYVQFYTTSNDPWTTQDNGGNSVDLLYEFRNAWAGNIPNGANLAAFLSGASLGGGVAWLDVLCNSQYGFSVSGNINGGVTFPVTQGSNTWDFMVFNHEVGHNFGSPHTHDFCPPLDECAPSGYFGQCQNAQNCTNQGTILSYCHLCSGGMNNITTYFHPTVVAVMRAKAEASCLPPYGGGGPQTLFFDDFESGDFATGGWTISHTGRVKVHTAAAYAGTYGAKLKKGGVGTGACTLGTAETWMEAPAVSTVGYSTVEVNVWMHFRQNELSCEFVDMQWWDGSAWASVLQVEDHTWTQYTNVALPAGAAGNPALRIRFITNAKGKKERAEIDDFEIVATP